MIFECGKLLCPGEDYPGATDEFENGAEVFVQCRVSSPYAHFLYLFAYPDGRFRLRHGSEVVEGTFGQAFDDGLWEREFTLGIVRVEDDGIVERVPLRRDTSQPVRNGQFENVAAQRALVVEFRHLKNQRQPQIVLTRELLVGFYYNTEYGPGDVILPIWPNRRSPLPTGKPLVTS